MAVTILVRDRNSRPVPKVKLVVVYKPNGISTVYTNEMGMAETVAGHIDYIDVYGKHKPVQMNAINGDSIPVSYP